MENLWKELLAYVKKKTVVKKVLEYVEKDILLKNVLKMYSTTCSEFYGNRFYSRSMCFRN